MFRRLHAQGPHRQNPSFAPLPGFPRRSKDHVHRDQTQGSRLPQSLRNRRLICGNIFAKHKRQTQRRYERKIYALLSGTEPTFLGRADLSSSAPWFLQANSWLDLPDVASLFPRPDSVRHRGPERGVPRLRDCDLRPQATLAARGESQPAFDERCIPSGLLRSEIGRAHV